MTLFTKMRHAIMAKYLYIGLELYHKFNVIVRQLCKPIMIYYSKPIQISPRINMFVG